MIANPTGSDEVTRIGISHIMGCVHLIIVFRIWTFLKISLCILIRTYVPNNLVMLLFHFRLNTRKLNGLRTRPTTKTVSKRKFDFASDGCIEGLKQIKLKKKSEAKIDWAVNAYIDWRRERLDKFQYDVPIYFADLEQLESLEKGNLNHVLCRFVPEVTKKRGTGPYPGATLYQMIVAIQRFLVMNKVKWKLLDDPDFDEMRTVLNNVMRERALQKIGIVKKQAGLITFEHEDSLWCKGLLGEDSPDVLRNTTFSTGYQCSFACCRRTLPP